MASTAAALYSNVVSDRGRPRSVSVSSVPFPLPLPLLRTVRLALVLTVALGLPAYGTAHPVRDLPRGGEVQTTRPDGSEQRIAFETRPDSVIAISTGGSTVELPITAFSWIAGRYAPEVLRPAVVSRAGYDVDDGQLTLYFSRRLPLPLVLVLFGLLAVAAVAFAAWALLRIRRDAHRKEELSRYREVLAASRESERLRLARDLHDGPLQEIHAVRMGLAAHDTHAGLEQDLLGAIRDLRQLTEDLRAPVLDTAGLPRALDALAERFRRRNDGIVVDLHVEAPADALPGSLRLALYRVCQEALANVVKHARASAVRLDFRADAERYELTVEDDGVGLPDRTPLDGVADGHFGLAGIRERAEAVGASFRVGRGARGGTCLSFSGPVVDPAHLAPA